MNHQPATATVRTETPEDIHRLEEFLRVTLGNRVYELRLLVRGSGLVLRGRASTYHVKQLAQHAAMQATGLPIEANEIEVRSVESGIPQLSKVYEGRQT